MSLIGGGEFRAVGVGVVMMLSAMCTSDVARAQEITHRTRIIASGLNSPWELRWGHDGNIWFTERNGRFSRMDPESGVRQVLLTDPQVFQWHEGGMMGFDFHPQFPDSPFVFIAHTSWSGELGRNILSVYRYTFAHDTLIEKRVIFGNVWTNAWHAGCRLLIDDSVLYFTNGDTGLLDSVQHPTSEVGKIFRIRLDGSVPEDNPFYPSATWSYGHRNPQGLVMVGSRLYSGEHGNNTDDEINRVTPGLNYGWPLLEGYCDNVAETHACDSTPLVEPLHSWTPTLGTSGIDYYDHDAIPEWRNSILVAALKDRSINQLQLDATGAEVISVRKYSPVDDDTDPIGRYRDFCISPDGRVFVSTSNIYTATDTSDKIFEFIRTGVLDVERSMEHDGVRLEVIEGAIVGSLAPDIPQGSLTVSNLLGQTVHSTTLSSGRTTLKLASLNLLSGKYLIRLEAGGSIRTLSIEYEH